MAISLMDEFQRQMQMARQGALDVANVGQQEQKQAAGMQLRQELANMFQGTPGMGPVIAAAHAQYQAGDPTMAETLYKKGLENLAPKTPPLSKELIAARLGVEPEHPNVKLIQGLPFAEQGPSIESINKGQELKLKHGEFAYESGRRMNQAKENAYSKRFFDLEKALNDTEVDLTNMKNLVAAGGVPEQGALLSIVSRKVAGERGVLTDNDIARLKNPTIGQTVGELKNYLTSHSEQTWPEDVKQAMTNLIGVADKKYQETINKELGGRLNIATGDKFLFDKKSGQAIDLMENLAQKYGFNYDPKTKKYVRGPQEEKQYSVSQDELVAAAERLGQKGAAQRFKSGKYSKNDAVNFMNYAKQKGYSPVNEAAAKGE